jgi:hypothetical protein
MRRRVPLERPDGLNYVMDQRDMTLMGALGRTLQAFSETHPEIPPDSIRKVLIVEIPDVASIETQGS